MNPVLVTLIMMVLSVLNVTAGYGQNAPCYSNFHDLAVERLKACADYWMGKGYVPVTIDVYEVNHRVLAVGSFQPKDQYTGNASRELNIMLDRSAYPGLYNSQGPWMPKRISTFKALNQDRAKLTVIWVAKGSTVFDNWPGDRECIDSHCGPTGLGSTQFENYGKQKRDEGYQLIDLVPVQEREEGNRYTTFLGTWVKGTDKRCATQINMTRDGFAALDKSYTGKGCRLTTVEYYIVDGQGYRVAAIWERAQGEWIFLPLLSSVDYQKAHDKYTQLGYRLYHVSALGDPTAPGEAITSLWWKLK